MEFCCIGLIIFLYKSNTKSPQKRSMNIYSFTDGPLPWEHHLNKYSPGAPF